MYQCEGDRTAISKIVIAKTDFTMTVYVANKLKTCFVVTGVKI